MVVTITRHIHPLRTQRICVMVVSGVEVLAPTAESVNLIQLEALPPFTITHLIYLHYVNIPNQSTTVWRRSKLSRGKPIMKTKLTSLRKRLLVQTEVGQEWSTLRYSNAWRKNCRQSSSHMAKNEKARREKSIRCDNYWSREINCCSRHRMREIMTARTYLTSGAWRKYRLKMRGFKQRIVENKLRITTRCSKPRFKGKKRNTRSSRNS